MDIHDMFLMVTGFMNYGQQTIRATRICIFCGNFVEYCPTNCLSMTEEYELSTYDQHELNYNQNALGHLPMSAIDDYTIRTIQIK
ncbi:hypothetical protein Lal_00033872 [Lupinus albus]|nr:hypothetical protein Lal_00033872 [Lupinus albus]